jgi:uncharacterized protein YndB with AHSA1/START domain
MTNATSAQVRKSILVEAPVERAFTVFTDRFGDFKPREHNLLAVPIAETVFEPRVGGHIYDRGEDGSECRWARVLVFEPPSRVVFSWVAEGPDRTRVELEHRHIDRHGPGWEAVTEGVDSEGGWPLYLDRYAALLTT